MSWTSELCDGKLIGGGSGVVVPGFEAICRMYVDFETSCNTPLQNLAQEQLYVIADLDFFSVVGPLVSGALGIETTHTLSLRASTHYATGLSLHSSYEQSTLNSSDLQHGIYPC